MKHLAADHNMKHTFTVANSPWVNGTVERCMRLLQDPYPCLQSKLTLRPQDWPAVVPMIQSALNGAPFPRLGRDNRGNLLTPLQVMTGLKPKRLLLQSSTIEDANATVVSLGKCRTIQLLNISYKQDLKNMYRIVSEKIIRIDHEKYAHTTEKLMLWRQNSNLEILWLFVAPTIKATSFILYGLVHE